jgi:hypothetical protein
MNSRTIVVGGVLAGMLAVGSAPFAQMTMQPTPRPVVTGENEPWFVAGLPITHAGNIYYPTGPVVHFNANEMVRTGHYQGIPLYSRTTIEPYSFVFVPMGGGLMQPYERRRAGELADSVGSMTSSFPIVRSSEQAGMEYVPGAGMVQAPAPPSLVGTIVDRTAGDVVPQAAAASAVGTTGAEVPAPAGPLETARRPTGVNAVFIEYESRRYFADGPAVVFDAKLFARVGEYHGFPVYRQQGQDKTLYVPPLAGRTELVAPYRAR